MPLTSIPTLYAVSDFRDGDPSPARSLEEYRARWQGNTPVWQTLSHIEDERAHTQVIGGYMERLPSACLRAGIVDYAERWYYTRDDRGLHGFDQPLFGYRAFHLPDEGAPLHSDDMLAYIHEHGAPHILCVWGLGVSEEIMRACADSFKIYYPIDAPPLRVPPEVSRHFDLILVGGEWQREEVQARHPGMATAMLTIGPEFADDTTFRPLGIPFEERPYDLIYVACAQPYKQHEVLFQGMARCNRPVKALCIVGYGERDLRAMAADYGADVEVVGPPGVSYDRVNEWMNRSKIGVVAGEWDGCPAVMTEYMLAGLPVLANRALCCGLQYITPETGWIEDADTFHHGIEHILDHWQSFDPRPATIARCGWATSVGILAEAMRAAGYRGRLPG